MGPSRLHARDGAIKRSLRPAIFGKRGFRAHAPDALLRHQFVEVVGEPNVMLNGPYTCLNRTARSFLCLHVSGYFQAARVGRFTDEQLDVLNRIQVRLAVHADLDYLGAKQYILPDRLDDLVGRISVKVFGIDDVMLLDHLRCWIELPAHAANDDARIYDHRSRDPSLLDGLTQRYPRIARYFPGRVPQ